MLAKRNYSFWATIQWTYKPFVYGALYAGFVTIIFHYSNLNLSLPWQPISVMGIAVAFYLGFKNNSSYDRTWEARKIWGSIVNNSRTFGAAVISFLNGENDSDLKKELIYRHIAWMTALRYQLRLSRPWEHTKERIKGRYVPTICEEYIHRLDMELINYITEKEFQSYSSKANIATQIMAKQSKRLQELHDQNYYDSFRHMELHNLVLSFYEDQGKSERIKNFPFPRQYASTALWITLVFCSILPFGIIDTFAKVDVGHHWMVWFTVPITALVVWIFFLMEKIGDYSENPFEGTYNDVPITNIARAIEIDLREMIDDENIPAPIQAENGFLM